MESVYILLAILVMAVLGRANAVAIAAAVLLIIKLLQVDRYIFPSLEKFGMFWGLALLIAAILIPIAQGKVSNQDIWRVFTSWGGILALILSLVTTYLSGLGVQYLTIAGHSDIMPALILGAVLAAAFLGGVPVGPFITSGFIALVMKILERK